MMTRYFLEVMYDGTKFHGSQLQGTTPTVQLSVNKALSTLLRTEVESFGASRTDEGVHALSNFYHFEIEEELHPQFHYKLNSLLPHAVSVRNIYRCVGEPINARFDARSRKYRYKIYSRKNPFYDKRGYYFPYKINTQILNETAAIIKEYENFESFSKRNTQSKTFVCKIYESYWEEQGDQLHYIVRANRFLRGMVRGLTGTQLQAGRQRISVEDFKKIIEVKDCTKADFSVPGHGLYLEEIIYPEGKLELLNLK
ncbi:MAG TPA: tRNA pseudouridine synthase A [Flavipsychrobacter sp.]|nr:tRNA pseudouridine synthase A [Flavipsychrobacter sp.]